MFSRSRRSTAARIGEQQHMTGDLEETFGGRGAPDDAAPNRAARRRGAAQKRQGDPLAVHVDEAIETSGLGRTKIYALIKEGKLKTVAIGRRRLVVFSSLMALVAPET